MVLAYEVPLWGRTMAFIFVKWSLIDGIVLISDADDAFILGGVCSSGASSGWVV